MGPKRNKCCFLGCSNTKAKYPDLHFFQFPVKRKEVCDAWLLNCGDEALESLPYQTLAHRVVCDQHFSKECFTNDMRARLNLTAVPTLLSQNMTVQGTESPEVIEERRDNLPPLENLPQCSRKLVFDSPKTPTTPQYKKFKPIKNRQVTPKRTLKEITLKTNLNKVIKEKNVCNLN